MKSGNILNGFRGITDIISVLYQCDAIFRYRPVVHVDPTLNCALFRTVTAHVHVHNLQSTISRLCFMLSAIK